MSCLMDAPTADERLDIRQVTTGVSDSGARCAWNDVERVAINALESALTPIEVAVSHETNARAKHRGDAILGTNRRRRSEEQQKERYDASQTRRERFD